MPFDLPTSVRDRTLRSLRRLTRAAYRAPRGRIVLVRGCEAVRRRFARRPRFVVIDDFDADLTIEVDLADHIGSHLFWAGTYSANELAVLDRCLEPDHVFVDVGANIGVFTLYAAKRVPRGRVLAFEPLPALHAQLAHNAAANGFAHVETHALALSDAPGETAIYLPDQRYRDGTFNDSMATLYAGGTAGERAWRGEPRVAVTTLDSFSTHSGLDRLDVVKIDIEGGELPALRGGAATISGHRPRLIVEANVEACRRAGYQADELIHYLQGELGYRLEVIGRGGQTLPLPTPLAPWQNLLCTPR